MTLPAQFSITWNETGLKIHYSFCDLLSHYTISFIDDNGEESTGLIPIKQAAEHYDFCSSLWLYYEVEE